MILLAALAHTAGTLATYCRAAPVVGEVAVSPAFTVLRQRQRQRQRQKQGETEGE